MVKGLAELNRRFDAIPARVKAEVRAEIERNADMVVREMKALVPKDTGRLRDSIGWTWGAAPAGSVSVGSVRGGSGAGRMAATIYAGRRGNNLYDEGFYAPFLEFGTVKMPAHPFFFPVWRSNRRLIRGRLTRAVTRAVKAG